MKNGVAALGLAVLWIGCGGSPKAGFEEQTGDPTTPADAGGGGGNPGFGADSGHPDSGVPSSTCVNLQCQQQACAGGGSTTVSGTIYDPAGKNPLYGVVVYVPNAKVAPIVTGASCDACDALYTGSPIASAVTDAAGKFTMKNVPAGANIPVVIQIGKWRKQITIANVAACKDNAQPDKSLTLPKNHSEGDIPSIAISTGNADSLECLLRRVGLDASEYGPGNIGAGRIHIFQGGTLLGSLINGGAAPNTSPAAPQASAALWSSKADLMKHDIVLLSCEGGETGAMNQQALLDYTKAGGRVFASHFHYSWFNTGPFGGSSLASWSPGSNNMGDVKGDIVTTLSSGAPFPKGQALAQWLGNVGALTAGKLPISQARHNSDVTSAHTASQAWIKADATANPAGATEYFSFNTPIGVPPAMQCGRVVFSALHVGGASGDVTTQSVPNGCGTGNLSPQEKALEFMLFDLSSCVTPDDQPPPPPPAVPVK